jgi:hypothetical protein
MGKIYSSQKKRIKRDSSQDSGGDSFPDYGSNRRLPRLYGRDGNRYLCISTVKQNVEGSPDAELGTRRLFRDWRYQTK